MDRFNRSIPYFKILCQTKKRKSYLKNCPEYVVDDMCEILYNVLQGKAEIDKSQLKYVNKVKNKLNQFIRKRKHPSRRKFVENQDGGFLSAIGALL